MIENSILLNSRAYASGIQENYLYYCHYQGFEKDAKRLDKAFRRFIRRSTEVAKPDDKYVNEMIVCHGNVIAYIVLR